jgi:hypothetical protein
LIKYNISEQQRVHVILSAAHENGQIPPGANFPNDLGSFSFIIFHVPWKMVKRDVAKEVVRDALLLGRGDFIGNDGEAMVQLHGIRVYNLSFEAGCELHGQLTSHVRRVLTVSRCI